MKSKICSIMLSFLTVGAFAQDIHSGKVVGSFDYGNKDVTTIYDEVTGCERRTTPHEKGLFIPNENVEIIIDNKQLAEVVKPQMTEKVYTKKDCDKSIDLTNEEIVAIHNEFIEWYYSDEEKPSLQGTPYDFNNQAGVAESLIQIYKYSVYFLVEKKNFDKDAVLEDSQKAASILARFKDMANEENRYLPEEFASKINALNPKGTYSEEIKSVINNVYSMAYNDVAIEDIKTYLSNELDYLTGKDYVAVDLLIKQINASLDVWFDVNTPVPNYVSTGPGGLKCGTWVVISDGIGGVCGFIFGGVGSIVVGTAFSAGTSEDCDEDE